MSSEIPAEKKSIKTRLSKANRYGIVSGWYLFGIMDEFAQSWLHGAFPKEKFWLTKCADVRFYRQCLPGQKLFVRANCIDTAKSILNVQVRDKNGAVICSADLCFVPKNHLSVEPKKRQK